MIECQQYIDDFRNISTFLISDLRKCINKQVVKAKFYVNALLTDLKDTGADLRSIND